MGAGTTYIPAGYPLDASRLQAAGQGLVSSPQPGETTNMDLLLTDDMILTGVQLLTNGATFGDYIVLQAMVGGQVVATPIPGPWYVPMNGDDVFDLIIPTKIAAGITLRAVYHSTSGLPASPQVAIDYKLWKVLM